MYCSECKLRVADESVVICPVCQGVLQPESEIEEKPEPVDFVDELAAVFETDQDPEIKLDDKLDAYVRDDADLDFDPAALGLKASDEEDPAASADDIRVLADLWEKEDIGADLDGVFADAFNLEEVDPEPVPVAPVAMKSESPAPEYSEEPTPVMSTPKSSVPVEKSRSLGLPLLIFIVLLAAGGGSWFYMQNAGVKSENKIVHEVKSPAPVPVEPQVKSRPEPVVVNNKPVKDETAPVVEENSVAAVKSPPAGDATVENSAGDNRDSVAAAENKAEAPAAADSGEAASDLPAVTDAAASPSAEPLADAGPALSSMVEKKTLPESAAGSAAENQQRETVPAAEAVSESIPAKKENAVVVPEKVTPAAVQEAAAAGPRYVVHIGSFKNEAGAARQLAKLQKKGFAAYKVEVDLGEKGVWQRIFVPGGVLKSDARQVQEQLAKSFPREESLIRKIKK